jgi:pyrroline-5-carboxylate reductase
MKVLRAICELAISQMRTFSGSRVVGLGLVTILVPEQKLESYAIMSAMLPTYFWFQWKELIEIGSKIGLTVEASNNKIRDTLLAAIRTYFYSGLHADQVIDLIPV